MSYMRSQEFGYLLVNGLSDGRELPRDRAADWWWARVGIKLEHSRTNWYSGTFEQKRRDVRNQVEGMLHQFPVVVMIGSSAGGGLIGNVFDEIKDASVCGILAHARTKVGDYPDTSHRSLYRCAHLDEEQSSQSFYDSVRHFDEIAVPRLTFEDKKRLLVLTQLTDLIVPLETMGIDGVKEHRSIAFGHSGGLVVHTMVDRDLIMEFAAEQFPGSS